MYRKAMFWTLILAILLGMFGTPVYAANQVTLDKSTYAAGERVQVTVTGVTQEMVDDSAFVGLYNEGAEHNQYQRYEYTRKVGTNTVNLTAPDKKGTYEMRFYSMDDYYSDATMLAKVVFTVGTVATPTSSIKISLDKSTNYATGERVQVTVAGVTEEMTEADAFVGLYNEGAEHNQYQRYEYTRKVGTNMVNLTAPDKKGTYEMRFYSMDDYYSDATMLAKVVFTVGTVATPTSNVKISLDKTTFAAGERVRAIVTGVTEEMTEADAFVGLYDEGAAHNQSLWGCTMKAQRIINIRDTSIRAKLARTR